MLRFLCVVSYIRIFYSFFKYYAIIFICIYAISTENTLLLINIDLGAVILIMFEGVI